MQIREKSYCKCSHNQTRDQIARLSKKRRLQQSREVGTGLQESFCHHQDFLTAGFWLILGMLFGNNRQEQAPYHFPKQPKQLPEPRSYSVGNKIMRPNYGTCAPVSFSPSRNSILAPTVQTTDAATPARSEVQAQTLEDSVVAPRAVSHGAESPAEATVRAETIRNSVVVPQAVTTGSGSPALAAVEAETIEASTVAPVAMTTAPESPALARVEAETIEASTVAPEAVSFGREAPALAAVEAATIDGSVVSPQAYSQGPAAPAEAAVEADTVTESMVAPQAVTLGEASPATAGVEADTVEDSTLQPTALSHGAESDAEASIDLVEAEGAVLAPTAAAYGRDSNATAEVDVMEVDEETVVAPTAFAADGAAEVDVDLGLPTGVPGEQEGTVLVNAQGAEAVHVEVDGAENLEGRVASQGEVTVETDAENSELHITGAGVSDRIEGTQTRSERSIVSSEPVRVTDAYFAGAGFSLPGSDNTLSREVVAPELTLDTTQSREVNVQFSGTAGDNVLAAYLPRRGDAAVVSDLGDGTDLVETARGDGEQALAVTKTDGVLEFQANPTGTMPNQGRATTVVDAGDAVIQGDLVDPNTFQDQHIYVRGTADTLAGANLNPQGLDDALILEIPEGQPIPAAITEPAREARGGLAGLLGRGEASPAQGAIPPGWSEGGPTIDAAGFERIVIRQGGEIVASFGQDADTLPSFEEEMARVRELSLN